MSQLSRNALKRIKLQKRLALWVYSVALLPQALRSNSWSLRSLGLHASQLHSKSLCSPWASCFALAFSAALLPQAFALVSCLLRSHSHSGSFHSLWHSCLLYSQSLHFLRLLAVQSHSQSLCYLGLCTCILGRFTSSGYVLHTHSLGGFAPSGLVICAHIIGRFAPLGFVLCTRILSCLAPLHFVLRTHILSRFAPSCFMLCTRILGSFAPLGFVLQKDKCVLIASLPRTLRLHFARFAWVRFELCAHKNSHTSPPFKCL